MNKLKMRGVQRDSVNQLLVSFFAVIFSIADQRMAHGRKLCANLVLQSRDQFHAYERRVGKSRLRYSATRRGPLQDLGPSATADTCLHAEIMHQRA